MGEVKHDKGTNSAVSFCNRAKAAAAPVGKTLAGAPRNEKHG